MAKAPKKDLDCGDDAKRDQVLKKMLGTPPKPKTKRADKELPARPKRKSPRA